MSLVQSDTGVFAILTFTCAFFFFIPKVFPKVFKYAPPIVWIYATPLVLTNIGLIPSSSPVYTMLKTYAIPMFIVIMLLEVNVKSAFAVAGRAIGVMLIASIGIVAGCIASFAIFKGYLPADAWKGVGALVGTWTGGTGNLAAVGGGLDISGETMGLSILTDTVIAIVWIPLLLFSKNFKGMFLKQDKVEKRKDIRKVADNYAKHPQIMKYTDFVYLIAIAFLVLWFGTFLSNILPEIKPVLSQGTWLILIITTITLILSTTPLQKIPGTRSVATGIIYIFVASMGAKAQLTNIAQAPMFLAMGGLATLIHGAFVVFAVKIMKVNISIGAIASAANHGGAASAPVVASFHDEKLVPLSIVLALVGYAIGNYLGFLTAQICYAIL
jgi:uncharacterized membrane protein